MSATNSTWAIGDFVRIGSGSGKVIWVIVDFWGESSQFAQCERLDRNWVHQSAELDRLVAT